MGIIFWVQLGFGQSDLYDRAQKKAYLDGESYYIYGDFLTAAKLLEPLADIDSNFFELYYLLGASYFELDEYVEAEKYLLKGKFFNSDAHFLLAQMHLYESDLEAAKKELQEFEGFYNQKVSRFKENQIKQFNQYLINAKRYIANAEIVNISNLGKQINSENGEYVPLISSDEELLIFTSRRMHKNNSLDPTGQPFEDVYYSEKGVGKTIWSKAELIPGKVNTKKHDACVGLSPDGRKLFLFRTNENLFGGDLYESNKIKGEWSVPIRMGSQINSVNNIEPSASISLDGRTFYFSSNRDGGFGGFDIYRVVKLPNNEWSLALNLGPKVNTEFNEDAPFIHPDGRSLYFSSQGHSSMGGYDIFKSIKTDDSWSIPENLGYPTNTTKDEIYFTISASEKHAYYSSDKTGGFGNQDIYQIDYLERSLRQSVIGATVTNSQNGTQVEAEISLLNLENDDLTAYLSNSDDGRFIFLVNPNVEYEIIIEADGFEEYSEIIQYTTEELMENQRKSFKLIAIE